MTRRRIGAHLADLCAGIAAIIAFTVAFATIATPTEAYAADVPPTPKLEKSVQLSGDNVSLWSVTKDGKNAIVRDDDNISFINLDNGEKKQASYSSDSFAWQITEDRKTLFMADGDAGTLTAYDARTGEATTLNGASTSDIYSMQVSKNGKQLAIISKNDDDEYSVQIYDVNGQKVETTRDVGEADSLLVSNDMKTVYTIHGDDSDATIEAMTLKDGTIKYTKTVDGGGDWGLGYFHLTVQLDDGTLLGWSGNRYFRIDSKDGTVTPLSQQAYDTFAYNSDLSVATVVQSSEDSLSEEISDSGMLRSTLVTYDMSSGKEKWSANMSKSLVNAYHGTGIYGSLSYDGRYMFVFGKPANGSSSSTLNSLNVVDTKTGAVSSTVLPSGMDTSDMPILTDSDSKLVALTDNDGNYRLSVFSTGIRMNAVDSLTKGGNPLLLVVIALVVVLALVLVVLILELRARKKGRTLFGFLGKMKARKGGATGAGAVPAVAPIGSMGGVPMPPAYDAQGNPIAGTPVVNGAGGGAAGAGTGGTVPPVAPISMPGATSGAVPAASAGTVPPVAPAFAPGADAGDAPTAVPPFSTPNAGVGDSASSASVPPMAPAFAAPAPSGVPAPPPMPGASVPPAPAAGVGAAVPPPAPAQARFCRHCGAQLTNPNARFCSKCGGQLG